MRLLLRYRSACLSGVPIWHRRPAAYCIPCAGQRTVSWPCIIHPSAPAMLWRIHRRKRPLKTHYCSKEVRTDMVFDMLIHEGMLCRRVIPCLDDPRVLANSYREARYLLPGQVAMCTDTRFRLGVSLVLQ